MNIVAIIQARLGSTRLPGKVLQEIGGKTMLAHVINRLSQSTRLNKIVVATTVKSEDDSIVEEARRQDADIFRGSEEDVLDRYYQAERNFQSDVIVRITADCPFIDASLVDHILQVFLAQKPDYASNTLKRSYPRGLDTEVIARNALERTWNEATKPHERVHVTPYIYDNPQLFRLISIEGSEDFSRHRWTVDTQEDMEFARMAYKQFNNQDFFSWREMLEVLSRQVDLVNLNKHIEQKKLEEC